MKNKKPHIKKLSKKQIRLGTPEMNAVRLQQSLIILAISVTMIYSKML